MAASKPPPLKEGYMSFLCPSAEKESWVNRYFVLWGQTDCSCARLEWYEYRSDFEEAKTVSRKRKAFFLEDLATVELEEHKSGKRMVLYPRDGLMVNQKILKTPKKKDIDVWYETILVAKKQLDRLRPISRPTNLSFKKMKMPKRGMTFGVLVAETSQSLRCDMVGKACVLNIQKRGVYLKTEDGNVINHWPLRAIRKYGQADNLVTIEAGRMAPTGEGLWHFYTDQSKAVVDEIRSISYQLLQDDKDDSDGYTTLGTDEQEETGHDYEKVERNTTVT